MLNIKTKEQVEKTLAANNEKKLDIAEIIINNTLKRDEALLIMDVIPRLKEEIAKSKYAPIKWFHFTLPLLEFEGYHVPKEEKERILHVYYHRTISQKIEGSIYYEDAYASMIRKVLKRIFNESFAFSKCDIDEKTKMVHFSLRMQQDIRNIKVEEESKKLNQKIDELVAPYVSFDVLAESVNDSYKMLKGTKKIAVYEDDIEQHRIFKELIGEKMVESGLQRIFNMNEDKFDFNLHSYLSHSEMIQKIKSRFKRHGYKLQFRSYGEFDSRIEQKGVEVFLDFSGDSHKDVKGKTLITSQVFREAHERKIMQYDLLLDRKAHEVNAQTMSQVIHGQYDESIAQLLMEKTLMNFDFITSKNFSLNGIYKELDFGFLLHFNRELPKIHPFERKYYKFDGLANRYLNGLSSNVVSVLRKRYPFFKDAELSGDRHYDFQHQENQLDLKTSKRKIKENVLEFYLSLKKENFNDIKEEVMEWLASQYGTLDIHEFLEKAVFTEEGIAKKIEDYTKQCEEGKIGVKRHMEIEVGTITNKELIDLYEGTALAEKTKELFAKEDEKSAFYRETTVEFRNENLKQTQSVRLYNLFVQALYQQPMYHKIKELLVGKGYKLCIEMVEDSRKEMETGAHNIYNGKMKDTIQTFSARVFIK